MNSVNGVTGVFNVQGYSWSRKKRQFHTHDPTPPTLQTLVRPADIQGLTNPSATAISTHTFVIYSDLTQQLTVATHDDGVTVRLAAKQSDVLTVAPLLGAGSDVQLACVGLMNMLNAGGAILEVHMNDGRESWKAASCQALVKGCGELLVYASAPPSEVSSNGAALLFTYDAQQKKLVIHVPESSDLKTMVQILF